MTSKKRTVSELMASEKLEEVEKKSKEITTWMEGLLGEKLPKPTLRESLLDGVYLCKLVNVLAPGSLKKYHKKPKMLAMKIENIGFFLATCKTRLSLPPALLFQPTDLHDDSDVNSIRKVLNVLSFLQGDNDFIKADEDDDGGDEPEPSPAQIAANEPKVEPKPEPKVEPPKPTPKPEPKVEPPKPEPKPNPVVSHPPAKLEPKAEPTAHRKTSTGASNNNNNDKLETDWYLHDQKSVHVDIQDELVSVILNTANSELSVDSKRKLLRKLQTQITFVEEKILSSSDDQLRTLAHSMGLGESINDIPKTKGRDWLVEFILKYGRAH
jgi:hypothetical protein